MNTVKTKSQKKDDLNISDWWDQLFDTSDPTGQTQLMSKASSVRTDLTLQKIQSASELYSESPLKVRALLEKKAHVLLSDLIQKDYLRIEKDNISGSYRSIFSENDPKTLGLRWALWLGLASAYKAYAEYLRSINMKTTGPNVEPVLGFNKTPINVVAHYLRYSLEEIVGSEKGFESFQKHAKKSQILNEYLSYIGRQEPNQFIYAALSKPVYTTELKRFLAGFSLKSKKEIARYVKLITTAPFEQLIRKAAEEDHKGASPKGRPYLRLLKILLEPLIAQQFPVWDLVWCTETHMTERGMMLHVQLPLSRAAVKLSAPKLGTYLEEVKSQVEFFTLSALVNTSTKKSDTCVKSKVRI